MSNINDLDQNEIDAIVQYRSAVAAHDIAEKELQLANNEYKCISEAAYETISAGRDAYAVKNDAERSAKDVLIAASKALTIALARNAKK